MASPRPLSVWTVPTLLQVALVLVPVSAVTCVDKPVCGAQLGEFLLPHSAKAYLAYYSVTGQRFLGEYDENATAAVVMVHGAARNADDYLCWALQAVANAGLSLSNTFVLAPWFAETVDGLPSEVIQWSTNHSSAMNWRDGGFSVTPVSVSSYEVMDCIVSTLANRTLYPHLSRIILAGHSAGGQYVSRYAMLGKAAAEQGILEIPIIYLPANPSSWAWINGSRPLNLAKNGSCSESYCNNASIISFAFAFGKPEAATGCPYYNYWGYGFQGLDKHVNVSAVKKSFFALLTSGCFQRLLGGADVCNDKLCPTCDSHDLDTDCEANLQGWCRLQRGFAYDQHLRAVFANDSLRCRHAPWSADLGGLLFPRPVLVPHVGHNACRMFTSPQAARLLQSSQEYCRF